MNYHDPFVPDSGKLDSAHGFVGGLQIGVRQQFGTMTLGAEADISWAHLDSSGIFTTPLGSQWRIDSDVKMFGTARGVVGFLVTPSLLAYGTAGVAWGRVDVKQATTFVTGSGCTVDCEGGRTSGDFNHIGYAVGGGLEYALTSNWSLKAEYLYMDLGKENYALNGTTKPNGNVPYVETFGQDIQLHTARAGINYKF